MHEQISDRKHHKIETLLTKLLSNSNTSNPNPQMEISQVHMQRTLKYLPKQSLQVFLKLFPKWILSGHLSGHLFSQWEKKNTHHLEIDRH